MGRFRRTMDAAHAEWAFVIPNARRTLGALERSAGLLRRMLQSIHWSRGTCHLVLRTAGADQQLDGLG